ncbi:MAG: PAS domain-containing protein [Synechococcaceae cyanobacterium SM2_3_1]|nr:PAS domain-containing protein [Synechococcaceae cyanobacterium SM2_3_1]
MSIPAPSEHFADPSPPQSTTPTVEQAHICAFQDMVEHATDIISRFDRNYRHVYISPTVERVSGFSPRQFMGRTLAESPTPTFAAQAWQSALEQTFVTGDPQQTEVSFVDGKGQLTHAFQSNFIPEFGEEQQVHSVLVISRNITNLKQVEANLRQSEARYRALLEAIPDAVAQTNDEGDYLFYKPSALVKTYELDQDRLGHNLREYLAPEVAEAAIQHLQRALAEQKLQTFEYSVEVDQVRRYREARSIPYGEHEVLSLVRDVTDRKQAEADLEQALRQAKAANQAKSQFLANMSHELRTPLSAILGFAQLLASRATLSTEEQEYLRIIRRNGEHLLTLISDILEMSRIETGQESLQTGEFNLCRLAGDLVDLFTLQAQNRGIEVQAHLASDLPQWVDADQLKLRQILLNLFSHALDRAPQGQITLRISVLPPLKEAASPRLSITIKDTGPGMTEAEMTAFLQLDPDPPAAPQQEHRLSLSLRYLQLMGGQLTLTSEWGQGSCFSLLIPIQVLPDPAEFSASEEPTFAFSPPQLPVLLAALAHLSIEDLKQLHQAALEANPQRTRAVLETLTQLSPLAQQILTEWIESYQFDSIIGLIEKLPS